MSWRCEIAGEDAHQVTFEGPIGRLHADVHRGRIGKEVYRGLLSMSQPKQRLTLNDPFKVEVRRAEPRLLRIHPLNGRGGDVVLRMIDSDTWPKFLWTELREIFELKIEPGTTEAAFRQSGFTNGAKAAGVPKHSSGWSPERRAKQLQTLRDKGQIVKVDLPKRRKKKRGRKKVASGKLRTHQGQQHVPQADGGDPQGDGPARRFDAGQQEAVDLSRAVITA
jgi:hypothetical protein